MERGKKLSSASAPVDESGRVYHLGVKPGDVSKYVLLPGDPGRVKRIASFWDKAWRVAEHREYLTFSGRYKGVFISATSTGIGSPSTAIAVEELARVGSTTFIRVGTTGALNRNIGVGDIIISTGAVRFEGTSKQYVFPEYPAVASFDVTLALITAAEELGVKYHVGLTVSSDSFYVGQERPGYKGYLPPFQRGLIDFLRSVNVLNFEMEAAAIFTLANIYGLRAGSVCAAIANRETEEFIVDAGVDDAIKVANEAVKILSEWDQIVGETGSKTVSAKTILEWYKRIGRL
ncbi:uridine phosphorylase [Staphylothermus hellenicus]|uniref:Uridine phosphorylase n=1 Tax=Staphylothermus hellenicus (strain DSM 12710 / JCM 10830 / BK20S6-10-b1 / P8) TaxID=591019 RepID=D7DBC6_STAHD|nr:uridine phosphorylase [Staphylothermus hellenicus]ADI31473.1 uridine phosphorylase [Staphylothermus hellenicus DSM 12710]